MPEQDTCPAEALIRLVPIVRSPVARLAADHVPVAAPAHWNILIVVFLCRTVESPSLVRRAAEQPIAKRRTGNHSNAGGFA